MPSPREQVADHLVETCRFGGLDDSYGIIKSKQKNQSGREYWSVTFCKARILDGEICIYSPTFILVKWQTAIRILPPRGQQKFSSEREARDFITKNFINL